MALKHKTKDISAYDSKLVKRPLQKYAPIFLLPTVVAFAIGFVWPFLWGLYLSFFNFRTLSFKEFVGLDNFLSAFSDVSFRKAFIFTSIYTVVTVILVNVLAFLIALALTRGIRGATAFRTVFFMPNLIGGIVLGYIWQLIINGILYPYGQTLLSSANYGFLGLVVLMNWQMIGYMMVIYIAGLQSVPEDIIEAAQIDGASGWMRLKKIIFPQIMPSVTICTFLTLTNSFKLFDQNYALTDGGPSGKTKMLALDIYKTFYNKVGSEGVGQAKAVVFFIIVAVIALLQLYLTRDREA